MKIKIQVTADDIKKGKPGTKYSCPVARALKRTLHTKDLTVGCRISVDANYVMELTPRIASFIDRFDAGKKVKPFEFWFKL